MKLLHGDCLKVLRTLPDESFDSCVTDPPYGLKFMGKKWDYSVPSVDLWKEVLRVLKPGAWLLAFGGARTYHRMTVNIEDAGFEIRDQIMWVYGSGFPKSLDVSKAIDKAAGAEREVVSTSKSGSGPHRIKMDNHSKGDTGIGYMDGSGKVFDVTAPATDAARKWEGWGTALKPAHEPICVARKPFKGTVADNVLRHGTGAMNIDGCRIVGQEWRRDTPWRDNIRGGNFVKGCMKREPCAPRKSHDLGRWPANFIHDGSEEVVAVFPNTTSGGGNKRQRKPSTFNASLGRDESVYGPSIGGDSGSAARFFYCAKASRSERGEGNNHPTVKPLALMEYLCRLVTPPGGTVLDPFCGSGTTLFGAENEGFKAVGIDKEPDTAERRITLPLFMGAL